MDFSLCQFVADHSEVDRRPPRVRRCVVLSCRTSRSLYAFYGEDTGVRFARKHLGWYFASMPDSANTRASLMAEGNYRFAVCGDEGASG